MGLRTPLYDTQILQGAKIIDFGGWDMPLSFGSQIDEHHAVRRDAGIFDVSHMCIVDLTGARTREFLRFLLANDAAKLTVRGQALYSCMLLPSGGVIDDLIAYFMTESWFRLVVNAGTRRKDLAWIGEHAGPFGVAARERTDLAMLAVQGPNAIAKSLPLMAPERRGAARGSPASAAPKSTPGSWRVPDIPGRTASKSCCPRPRRPPHGGRSLPRASRPPGSVRATRCVWRRA